MEKIGCKRILERVNSVLNVSEMVTDASSTIIKMLTELEGNYNTNSIFMGVQGLQSTL